MKLVAVDRYEDETVKVKRTKCYPRIVQLSLPPRGYNMQSYIVREDSGDGGIVMAHTCISQGPNCEDCPV